MSAERLAAIADGDSIAPGWEALAHDHDRLTRGLRRRMIDEDAELVARAQAGDRAAFEALVRRHAGGLHAVVQRLVHDRHEAEEVTQEAFLRAWRGIGNFKGDARFFTWLFRIGVNEAWRRTSRRQRGSAGSLEEEAIDPADPRAGPEAEAELSELRGALEQAVRALDRRYRTALILRDVEGLSTAEAAAIMGMNEAAFKSRLHRARLAVRNAVDEFLDHE